MAKKLQPDVIEWILKLNSTQAQEEYHKLEKANRELQKENNATRKAMVELEKQGKKGSQEWKNLKGAIDSNSRTMSDNRAKMEALSRQINLTDMTANQLKKRLKELTREFENTSRATDPKRYDELRKEIDRTRNALSQAKDASSGLQKAFAGLTRMKELMVGFFLGIGTAIFTNVVSAFKNAFSIVVDFERENSKLAAILGTTREGIADMTKAARELGATTSFSAAEVTQLQIELAKLGFAKDQIIAMESAVLKFAKAVGTDLASASAFTGAALRIFGKEAGDAEEVLASFAVATTKSALDFSKLETSLAIVGPVAAAAGFSLEDTTAVLGMLANAGLDASSAATSTRNIILKMVDPAGDLAKALGGPVRNAEELAAGLKKLEASGMDLTKALELTDKRSVVAFQTLMKNTDGMVELKDSITNAGSAFNAMAETMGDNVAGALAELKSASEEFMLTIADGTSNALKGLIKALTTVVGWLQKGVTWIKDNSRWIKTVVAALVTWKVTLIAVNTVQKIWLALVKASGAELAGLTRLQKLHAVSTGLMSTATKGATASLKTLWATMLANPITAVITGITTLVSAIWVWKSSTEEMSEVEKRAAQVAEEHANKRKELHASIATERDRLLELERIAKDATNTEEQRLKAIHALNEAVPEYNGYIDKTTGALVGNTSALRENIRLMEQRMRLAYFKDEYEKYDREQREAEYAWYQAHKNRKEFLSDDETLITSSGTIIPKDKVMQAEYNGPGLFKSSKTKEWEKREKETRQAEDAAVKILQEGRDAFNEFISYMAEQGVSVADFGSEDSPSSTSSLPTGSTSAKDKGKGKGGRKDAIKEATAAIDAAHQQNLADIEARKDALTEMQYVIDKNMEMIDYCRQLSEALEELQSKTGESDTDLLNKITERQGKIKQDSVKAEQEINAAIHTQEEKFHSDFLAAQEAFYKEQQTQMEKAVQEQKITREAADIFLISEEKAMHETQLKRLKDYYDQVENAEYLGTEARKKRLKELEKEIKQMQSQVLTDTGRFVETLRNMTANPDGLSALKSNYESQRRALIETYEAMNSNPDVSDDDRVALAEEQKRRLLVLDYRYQEELYRIQEKIGLSWGDQYNLELLKLKQLHADGLIDEQTYQKERLKLGVSNAKKYFDFYAGLSGSMFQAIQDAEIAMSDAKYDELIRQAENNGQETAQLEQEKENKKLEIQKKYADVNFAIKVSQIIADTAVSIMKAFADLGPIGGAVAAAMLTATGAAQVMSAKAERDRIKKLQPKTTNTGSSESSGLTGATRVLSGFSEGGYTGDGGRYEVAGLVHKGEYVVPKPIMGDRRVIDAVSMIEAIRRQRNLPYRDEGLPMKGFASGGFTDSSPGHDNSIYGDLAAMLSELRAALKNLRAYVVYQDIERARTNLDRAKEPFIRKK